jgi:hypothetical protein
MDVLGGHGIRKEKHHESLLHCLQVCILFNNKFMNTDPELTITITATTTIKETHPIAKSIISCVFYGLHKNS